ncbi:YeeE/YedE family protein, partial [Psychrobacter sp. 1U2]
MNTLNTTTRVQPVNDAKDPIVRGSLALNAPQKVLIAGGVIAGLLLLIHLLDTQHISQSLLLGIGLLL